MNQCYIDHITITAPTIESGARLVKKVLCVEPQTGGEHPRMGTHNLLLRIGDCTFLEVIACKPGAKKPDRPRWFELDKIKNNTPPILKTWVVRTNDIHSTIENCSEPAGKIEPMSRGKTNWLITIPEDGSIPIHKGAPSLIQWKTAPHPATTLKNYGLSLVKLTIFHPEPKRLSVFLNSINLKGNIKILKKSKIKIIAHIDTPQGIKKLEN